MYIFTRRRPLWRLAVLALVGVLTVVVAHLLMSPVVYAGYPGGTRDPEAWYICSATKINYLGTSIPSDWSDELECERLQVRKVLSGPDAPYVSVPWSAESYAIGGEYHSQVLFLVAPVGIQSYQYRCNVQSNYVRESGSASTAVSGGSAAGGSGFNEDGSGWGVLNPGSCSSPFPCETVILLNVVASFRATQFDNFGDRDPVAGWDPSSASGFSTYPRWTVTAVANTYGGARAAMGCEMTDWLAWPGYSWQPSPIDIYNPFPEFPTPAALTPIPFSTLTTTHPVLLGITPGDTTCIQPMPEISLGPVTAFGYSLSLELPAYEFCLEEYSVDLELMGFDFGQLLIALAAVGTVGIIYNSIRRGG